jgi:hypothetical protein
MSEELTLKRGTAAEVLLSEEAFVVAVNELYNEQLNVITESAHEDVKKREIAYYRIQALKDIQAELTDWVYQKTQLLPPTEE